MRILKAGKNPSDELHIASCRYCGTVIEFIRSEAQLVPDQRDGDYLLIKCPMCHRDITKSAWNGLKPTTGKGSGDEHR